MPLRVTETGVRSFSVAWSAYVRGNIVTRPAATLIRQFVMSCAAPPESLEEDPPEEAVEESGLQAGENLLSLLRVHEILDRMSRIYAPA